MALESVGASKPKRRADRYDFVANLELRSFVWQHDVALAFNQFLSTRVFVRRLRRLLLPSGISQRLYVSRKTIAGRQIFSYAVIDL